MTYHNISTSNWDSSDFWSSINEIGTGHQFDFSSLPSNFSVEFEIDVGLITLSDGSKTFTIEDSVHAAGPDGGSADATLGGSTQLSQFSTF